MEPGIPGTRPAPPAPSQSRRFRIGTGDRVRYEILLRPRALADHGQVLIELCMRINGRVVLREWTYDPTGSLRLHNPGWDLEIQNLAIGPLAHE